MEFKIVVGNEEKLVTDAKRIRSEVFIKEQNIPSELDIDGWDQNAQHALVYVDDLAVGVARLAIHDDGRATLARVAVIADYRGRGLASKLVNALLSVAEGLKLTLVDIYPHEHLRIYYEIFGFKYVGVSKAVAGHQLIKMTKTLPS